MNFPVNFLPSIILLFIVAICDVHGKSFENHPNDLVNSENENKTNAATQTATIKKEPKFFDEFECK